MKTDIPRFRGVALDEEGYGEHCYVGQVHGAEVAAWRTKAGWLSSVCWSYSGVKLITGIHSSSWRSSLLSLRGIIRNHHAATAKFEPKKRKATP